jgi:hypothetical protein
MFYAGDLLMLVEKDKAEIKTRLGEILKQIIELLDGCGLTTMAQWFRERLLVVSREEPSSEAFQCVIKEIKSIIAGMGSFTDLPLTHIAPSRLTPEMARRRQWELADQLDEAIAALLE